MFISLPQACCCLVLHPESGKLWSPASEHLLDLVHCQLFKVQAQSLQQHPEHPGKLPDTDKMAFFLGNPSPHQMSFGKRLNVTSSEKPSLVVSFLGPPRLFPPSSWGLHSEVSSCAHTHSGGAMHISSTHGAEASFHPLELPHHFEHLSAQHHTF